MARIINVEEAASWSKEELQTNVSYLEVRCRWPELDRIQAILADKAPKTETSIPETPKEEAEAPVGTNETEDVPKTKKSTKPRKKKE